MNSAAEDDLFNTYQKNSVRIILKMMEESLHQTQQLLTAPLGQGRLYRKTLHQSDAEKADTLKLITEGLDLIRQMADKFDLQPVEEDVSSAIRGTMSELWASLLDTRARKLGRFGEVNPKLSPALDPGIERLAALALELADRM